MSSMKGKWAVGLFVVLGSMFASAASAAPIVTVGLGLPVVRVVAAPPPVVVVQQPSVWVPGHYVVDSWGRRVFVNGHWRGDRVVGQVVRAPARRVVVVRR
jgi:hypothetical protein